MKQSESQMSEKYRKIVDRVKYFSKARETKSAATLDDSEKYSEIINRSGLFNREYYLSVNEDVKKSGMDPLLHFINFGGNEGRDPSEMFNSKHYLSSYADVRELKVNPLLHFITQGKTQGRSALPKSNILVRKMSRRKVKKVDIVNVNFYDWTGDVLYKGGAERYVYDLAKILSEMGHKVRILQNATKSFHKTYRGIEVVGIVTGAIDSNGPSLRQMSSVFNIECDEADLIIASPIDLACEIHGKRVVGINHGIHWDSKSKRLYSNRTSDYMEIFDALKNVQTGVCVDTNFINWTRTYDYELGEKLKYIPNYYDKEEFHKTEKKFNKQLTVLYPRRLYDARGINITLEAFEDILGRYDQVNLMLVGQTTDDQVKTNVSTLISKYPGRVTLEEYDMEDMYKAYEKSQVVLIPTRYAEGTSLSCLEAMATNNVVIATNIGGLPNLVVNRFNGLLIEPNTKSLISAVESVILDRDFAERLAVNSMSMAEAFEKNNWNTEWKSILREML